ATMPAACSSPSVCGFACGDGIDARGPPLVTVRRRRLPFRLLATIAAAAAASLSLSCGDSTPAAPTATTTITLTASATQLPVGGSATVDAELVESTNRFVADGTMVRFATTLGVIDPADVPTKQGRATATLFAGNISGIAVISASAGAALSPTQNAPRIAIGASAASHVAIVANPSAVPFSGGTSAITATVVDAAGNPLASIPVTFSATAGSLTIAAVKTDQEGSAKTTLTTSQASTITATIGAQGSASGTPGIGPSASTSVLVAPRPQP